MLDPARPRKTVVVIEDDPLWLHIVQRAIAAATDLELAGTSSDGRDGLDAVRSLSPDVALVDLELPSLSGLEIIERLRDLPTAVVLMSARLSEDDRAAAAALGAAAVHKRDGVRSLMDAARRPS